MYLVLILPVLRLLNYVDKRQTRKPTAKNSRFLDSGKPPVGITILKTQFRKFHLKTMLIIPTY